MGLRLLIVDDNQAFLKSARELLEREGLKVVGVAHDGASALAAVDETDPEVVLVDVDLGPESGPSLAERLVDGRPRLLVILISAYPEEDLPGLVAQTPALGFIHKSQLSRQAIEQLVRRD